MADHNPANEAEASSRPQKRSRSTIVMPPPSETKQVDSSPMDEMQPDKPETVAEPTKEELYERAKAKKIAAINARNAHLEAEIERVAKEIEAEKALLKNKDGAGTVKQHIKLLHEYNEIRDVGQGMIGMIADNRGVRIAELYESGEFGVGVKD